MSGARAGSPRRARIAAAIRDHLSELIAREVKDPRVSAAGPLSVTHVELNADMSVCRVGVSFVAAEGAAVERALTGLEAAAGFLRGPLGRRLAIGRSPRLRFERDPSAEIAERLRGIVREDEARARAGDGGGGGSGGGGEEPES